MTSTKTRLSATLLALGVLALSATIAQAAAGHPASAASTHARIAAAEAFSAGDAIADAWAAADAGLDKAQDALEGNPTDADAGGLAGIETARDAVEAGLAKAADAVGNAGSQAP
jgi:hypothetical protein